MIDFASLPQKDPATGALRSEEEQETFRAGLGVMANVYASPRVLVLQHKRLPTAKEQELTQHGGVAPDDRPDLIPYAGEHCRSGWCTSETACALLLTEGGGHAYELGVGPVPVRRGVLPSHEKMRMLFYDESTRFGNPKDREVVTEMYLDLRQKVVDFEAEKDPIVSKADICMSRADAGRLRWYVFIIFILPAGRCPVPVSACSVPSPSFGTWTGPIDAE